MTRSNRSRDTTAPLCTNDDDNAGVRRSSHKAFCLKISARAQANIDHITLSENALAFRKRRRILDERLIYFMRAPVRDKNS